MSHSRLAVIALGVLALCDARQVEAQDRWGVRVNFDVGIPASSTEFHESITTAVHQEDEIAKAAYTMTTGPQFDGGVTMWLAGNLGVGVGYVVREDERCIHRGHDSASVLFQHAAFDRGRRYGPQTQ
jgi:hypothetical protein